MSLDVVKSLMAVFVFMAAVLGGLWPLIKNHAHQHQKVNREFPAGEAFAAGIFLGASLLHLLPEASAQFSKAGYVYPFSFLIAAVSFLFLLLLEHISVFLSHRVKNSNANSNAGLGVLAVLILSIHSLFEGAAVGTAGELLTAGMIFIAIMAHKSTAGFALVIELNRSFSSFKNKILGFGFFALMTPSGIFIGGLILSLTSNFNLLMPVFNSLAAGTFLYIGTLHGLERASLIKHCCNLKEFFMMFSGFFLMAVIAVWI